MNIGDRIGDYEIVAILGKGGMGEVYKVRNVLSERVEAMKVLLPDMVSSATAEGSSGTPLAERFQREIKVQATLDHPNIAKLYTALTYSNQLLMVMEYVEGESLEKILASGVLSVRDAVGYAAQVLDALGYAHERGVVHRDIKPANIMRTASGQVKLLDFGIARMKKDRSLTEAGHAVGSLYYMSPEQIKGTEPDPRSDLYSLGVTLYEMVTGRRPFQGDSEYSVMVAHLEQTPLAPVEIVPGVPPALSDIIVMAMAKDPAQRFQTAQAFAGALRATAPAGAYSAPPGSRTLIAPPPVPPPLPPPPFAQPPIAAPLPSATAAKPSSRRGLYMALGSIATLVVLAAAVIEVPKFVRARAGTDAAPPQQVAQTPAPQPAPAVETTPEPASASPAPTPAVEQPAPAEARPAAATPVRRATPATVVREPQPTRQFDPLPPPPAPTAAPVRAAQPPVPQTPSPELKNLREEFDQLGIRAAAVKSGLRSIEQQMAQQGLGLRGDIKATEMRMDYLMSQTVTSLRNGDADGARSSLEKAALAVEALEKFLGR
ncbi:MAG TPA: protein kinase [Bryobacteraceae bacterium]|nr:protein kinase [Bryobacteraceae bacterium]